jgi:O-antigen/teichoic acid export membrane protein
LKAFFQLLKKNEMTLRRSALGLAAAGGIEYGLQLAIPVILVRSLDAETFGYYRFLWLMAGTVLAVAPLFMPQALFYFLPRNQGRQGTIIGNVLLYLTFAGLVVTLAASSLNPYLPRMAVSAVQSTSHLSALFLGLWVIGSLLDVLPTADGAAWWQAKATVFIAVLRSFLLIAAAVSVQDLFSMTLALVVVATFKLIMIAFYLYHSPSTFKLHVDGQILKVQLVYAVPLAAGNALFLMRLQADQWVVASVLPSTAYAIFSVASVLAPIATLIRQPIYNAMMPRINAAYADGNIKDIISLVQKSNGITALVLIPVAGVLAVTAPELVKVVYTSRYLDAVPAMRIYLVGMIINAFAVGHLIAPLNLGNFLMVNNGICLIFSCLTSYVGLQYLGLSGAALGSVSFFAVSEIWSGYKISCALHTKLSKIIPWPSLLLAVIAAIGAAVFACSLSEYIKSEAYWLILIKGTLYVCAYCTIFFLIGGYGQARALMRPAVA